MAYKLTILDSALVDLEEALFWYNKISTELSEEIGKKIREAVFTIQSNPLQNPKIPGGFRKLNLERFPYKVVYKVSPEEILIAAIAHHKPRPNYWKRR